MSKLMLSLPAAAALMVTWMCGATRAAAPIVPPDSVGPNTIALMHIDAAHLNPELYKESAKVLLGAHVDTAEDAIIKFKKGYDKAVKAGMDGLTIVMGDEAFIGPDAGLEKQATMGLYVLLRPGADINAIKDFITTDMEAVSRDKIVAEQKGDVLVMHDKDMPLPTTFDAARAQAFADALGTISDAGLQIAIIPTPRVKESVAKMELPIKGLKDGQIALVNSKWITFAARLGATPGLSLTANTADANSAKQLSDGINLLLDTLKQQGQANPNPGDFLSAAAGPLAENLRPTISGNQVTVSIKGAALTKIAQIGVMTSQKPAEDKPAK